MVSHSAIHQDNAELEARPLTGPLVSITRISVVMCVCMYMYCVYVCTRIISVMIQECDYALFYMCSYLSVSANMAAKGTLHCSFNCK